MKYNKIVEGIFLERPNRFIAKVLIDGKEETVHVRNTGRCKELLIPGTKIILEDCSHNVNRKTKYSLIGVWKANKLINMDSQVPNKVVFDAIEQGHINNISNVSFIKREVTFGKSRFDIYFESGDKKGFVEVKGVTLEKDSISMFPDAPTDRGRKHVLEMIEAVKEGYRGIIFFLIQMDKVNLFKLNWEMDPKFSQAVKLASENGVEIMAYNAIVSPNSINIGKNIDISFLNK